MVNHIYFFICKYFFNDKLVELKFIPVHGVLDFKIVNNLELKEVEK